MAASLGMAFGHEIYHFIMEVEDKDPMAPLRSRRSYKDQCFPHSWNPASNRNPETASCSRSSCEQFSPHNASQASQKLLPSIQSHIHAPATAKPAARNQPSARRDDESAPSAPTLPSPAYLPVFPSPRLTATHQSIFKPKQNFQHDYCATSLQPIPS